jgi:hypothetical protein
MLSIVCSLSRVQDPISAQKVDDQASRPNHIVKLGKRQCTRRHQHMNPNQQQRLFHVFQVFSVVQLVPKLCGHYVDLQLFGLFENQGLLAKNFTN